LVIDVGSTTTDIVPLTDGAPAPLACDDVGRMATGELVYTGVERTPVAAIVHTLPWPGMGPGRRPIASERYADSRDVWLLLGGIPEDAAASDTADGRPATKAAARPRLARMLLADPEAFSSTDALAAAEWCARAQARTVARAIARVSRSIGWQPTSVVLSGHGTCLARRAVAHLAWPVELISLPDLLGPDASRAACAHAIALIDRGLVP
jgi:probable H4MPT-linked C1 transfer pathway protein